MPPRTRRGVPLLAAVLVASAITACERRNDPTLGDIDKRLAPGLRRDSVLRILQHETGRKDSLPLIYRKESFLFNGSSLEVLYFSRLDKRWPKDSLPPEQVTPLVFVNDQLAGWTWAKWDTIATAARLPVKGPKRT